MRKFLAFTLAASLLFVGAETALAAIPHSHGGDFDHSSHRDCPVHQTQLQGPDLALAAPPVFFFVLEVFFAPAASAAAGVSFSPRLSASRGPPAVV